MDNKRYDNKYIVNGKFNPAHDMYSHATTTGAIEACGCVIRFEFAIPYSICHMSPFEIDIKNPLIGGIVSNSIAGKVFPLSNVDTGNGRKLEGITMPPTITIKPMNFDNYDLECHDYWYGTYAIDPAIRAFTFVDVMNGEAVEPGNLDSNKVGSIIDDIVSSGDLGQEKFGAHMHRNPRLDYHDNVAIGSGFGPNSTGDILYGSKILYNNQRLTSTFLWFDHDDQWFSWACDALSETAGMAADVLLKYYTAGASDGLAAILGGLTKDGSKSYIKDFVSNTLKGTLCHDDNEDTDYHWLANNIFNLTRLDKNLNSPCDVSEVGNYKEPYDWNLWGVGKHGMYKVHRKKAFGSGFYHTQNSNGTYNVTSKANSATEIEILLGHKK